MALPSTGKISIKDIATEYVDEAPHSLSEFATPLNNIKMSDFRGAFADKSLFFNTESLTIKDAETSDPSPADQFILSRTWAVDAVNVEIQWTQSDANNVWQDDQSNNINETQTVEFAAGEFQKAITISHNPNDNFTRVTANASYTIQPPTVGWEPGEWTTASNSTINFSVINNDYIANTAAVNSTYSFTYHIYDNSLMGLVSSYFNLRNNNGKALESYNVSTLREPANPNAQWTADFTYFTSFTLSHSFIDSNNNKYWYNWNRNNIIGATSSAGLIYMISARPGGSGGVVRYGSPARLNLTLSTNGYLGISATIISSSLLVGWNDSGYGTWISKDPGTDIPRVTSIAQRVYSTGSPVGTQWVIWWTYAHGGTGVTTASSYSNAISYIQANVLPYEITNLAERGINIYYRS